MTKQDALAAIDRKSEELCRISDDLWDHPETAYEEHFAARRYCDYLRENGFEVEEQVAGIPTAFCGTYGSGRPVIGILAEFDALPNLSQKAECTEPCPVEEGGAGHGCGHNLLGVGSLAAALAVKEYLAAGHPGCVKLFGCPAEEGGAGKSFMARDGAFDCLDLALTWHPGDANNVAAGSNLANQSIRFHFQGKAAHAAICPELGRSALDACELMNVGVQFLREHVPQECRIHYAITNAGGNLPGVVQATADVSYLMRAPRLDQVEDLAVRITNIAKGAALMTDTKVEAEFIKACANVLPNRVLGLVLQKNFDELGGPAFDDDDRALAAAMRKTMKSTSPYYVELANAVPDPELRERLLEDRDADLYEQVLPYDHAERCSSSSSDVGDVSMVCPTSQICVVTMPAGTGMHSWQEVAVGKSGMAHKGMLQAGRIIAASAIDLLNDPESIQKAKEEHERRTEGHPFKSLIPKSATPKIPSNA